MVYRDDTVDLMLVMTVYINARAALCWTFRSKYQLKHIGLISCVGFVKLCINS